MHYMYQHMLLQYYIATYMVLHVLADVLKQANSPMCQFPKGGSEDDTLTDNAIPSDMDLSQISSNDAPGMNNGLCMFRGKREGRVCDWWGQENSQCTCVYVYSEMVT